MKTINLLVIDDDPTIVRFLEKIAQRDNYSFCGASSGVEGVEILSKNHVDVVIVDLNLPHYTGMEILKYVKSNKKATEVIFVTGQGSITSAVDALKEGAYDFILKPFETIDRPIICIKKALEKVKLTRKVVQFEKKQDFRIKS